MTSLEVRTLILGAGAAGMMCAAHAGPGVLIIDHAKEPGEKIRISGGGRCNFTNTGVTAGQYISGNPHFCKSALSRYSQSDFIDLVERHAIPYHEKTLGQLFCDGKATQIVTMLRDEMARAGADLWLQTSVGEITRQGEFFEVRLSRAGRDHLVRARNLVLATGGKPIPKMGASDLSLRIAQRFGLRVTPTRAGLVPFTFDAGKFTELAGTAVPATVTAKGPSFTEALLFTHRGLSGPAILQASSYWREGEEILVDLDPDGQLLDLLRAQRGERGRILLRSVLGQHFPKRLVAFLEKDLDLRGRVADQSDEALGRLSRTLRELRLRPSGTEGYRTAEVMVGGIDTGELSSKTMEATRVPGLFAIGEAVDVTGWLGGYNFQWAWSSGWAAGRAICQKP